VVARLQLAPSCPRTRPCLRSSPAHALCCPAHPHPSNNTHAHMHTHLQVHEAPWCAVADVALAGVVLEQRACWMRAWVRVQEHACRGKCEGGGGRRFQGLSAAPGAAQASHSEAPPGAPLSTNQRSSQGCAKMPSSLACALNLLRWPCRSTLPSWARRSCGVRSVGCAPIEVTCGGVSGGVVRVAGQQCVG
jgi:hypothetical protein